MAEAVQITVDDEGCMSLPRVSHERLGLTPGMTLVVEEADDDGLRLRVQPERPRLVRKGSALVVAADEQSAESTDWVRLDREKRMAELMRGFTG